MSKMIHEYQIETLLLEMCYFSTLNLYAEMYVNM